MNWKRVYLIIVSFSIAQKSEKKVIYINFSSVSFQCWISAYKIEVHQRRSRSNCDNTKKNSKDGMHWISVRILWFLRKFSILSILVFFSLVSIEKKKSSLHSKWLPKQIIKQTTAMYLVPLACLKSVVAKVKLFEIHDQNWTFRIDHCLTSIHPIWPSLAKCEHTMIGISFTWQPSF